MNRDYLIDIANENQEIVRKGFYVNEQNEHVKIFTRPGRTYTPKELEELKILNKSNEKGKVFLMGGSTVDAVIKFKRPANENVGVLNFASGRHPGGGYLRGRAAQEETLCQSSNLYETIKDSFMYEYNNKQRNPKYSNHMVISDVTFFRDSYLDFLKDPIKTVVVTSPAVNVRDMKEKRLPLISVNDVMTVRMEYILKLFAARNCKTVILGAFGCGVFENNPHDVAEIWRTLLFDKGYIYCFEEVVFAIYDTRYSKNLDVFKKILDKKL